MIIKKKEKNTGISAFNDKVSLIQKEKNWHFYVYVVVNAHNIGEWNNDKYLYSYYKFYNCFFIEIFRQKA